MTLMWMKKQAPWVIFTFGIFILVGLLWMDNAGSYQGERSNNIVGKVDGQEIPTDRFQQELNNYLRGEEARSGKAPEGMQLLQIRQGMFNYKVQSILMDRIHKDYQIHASQAEMWDYIVTHPQEVAGYLSKYRNYESLPAFMQDSTIDQGRYEAWLSQDTVFDRYSMRELEAQLKAAVIPQQQIQALLRSQLHRTGLEEAFTVSMRENKAKLKYYHVPLDSFPVAADKFKDPELKAYFEANPDSFHFREEAARQAYVAIPLVSGKQDTADMLELARQIKEKLANGDKFADLAADYSSDAATAEKGGKLEGLRGRETFDPAFAEAAFKLKPGETSEPVLTQAGYHIILLHDRRKEGKKDTAEKIEVSHILLKITAGNETIASLENRAEELREAARTAGFEKAAKDAGFEVKKTAVFDKSNMVPLGTNYVAGINSFAFSEYEAKENVSEPLQSEEAIYVFARDAAFDKGRNFERAKPLIVEILAKQEKTAAARKELEAQKGAIAAAQAGTLPSRLGKAMLDSTAAGAISADNWLPGFGYSSPSLFKAFTQPVDAWGEVLTTDMGAVIAKVTEKNFLSPEELRARGDAQAARVEPYLYGALFQEWAASLPKTAKVENKMDLVFRN